MKKIISNKKILFISLIGIVFITLFIVIGNSFAFKESLLDINDSNTSPDVGDVVKLRKYILNGYKTYSVSFNFPYNSAHMVNFDYYGSVENTVEDTDARFYAVTPPGTHLNIVCTNNPDLTYEDDVIIIHNVSKNIDCNVTVSGDVKSINKSVLGTKAVSKYIDQVVDVAKTSYDKTYVTVPSENGTSFVARYRGEDVNFAGLKWEIIRFNADGSIRMMLKTNPTELTGVYNSNGNIGYMYTLGELHGTNTSSDIKNRLDKWYEDNLLNYSDYIADEVFCNDRSLYNGTVNNVAYSGDGLSSISAFAAAGRLIKSTAFEKLGNGPSLDCSNINDAFTVNDTVKGNGKLKYPIGLISADEVIIKGKEVSSTLPTDSSWTLSPYNYDGTNFNIFSTTYDSIYSGFFYSTPSSDTMTVRPVINLKKDTLAEIDYEKSSDEILVFNVVTSTKNGAS